MQLPKAILSFPGSAVTTRGTAPKPFVWKGHQSWLTEPRRKPWGRANWLGKRGEVARVPIRYG